MATLLTNAEVEKIFYEGNRLHDTRFVGGKHVYEYSLFTLEGHLGKGQVDKKLGDLILEKRQIGGVDYYAIDSSALSELKSKGTGKNK